MVGGRSSFRRVRSWTNGNGVGSALVEPPPRTHTGNDVLGGSARLWRWFKMMLNRGEPSDWLPAMVVASLSLVVPGTWERVRQCSNHPSSGPGSWDH